MADEKDKDFITEDSPLKLFRGENVLDFERQFIDELPAGVLAKGFRKAADSTFGDARVVVRPGQSIQQAIDIVNNAGGGTVFLLPGTHKPPTDLTLYSNINLIGDGQDTSIINFSDANRALKVIAISALEANQKKNFSIQDLTVRDSTATAAIDIDYVQSFEIDNVRVTSNNGKGIRIKHAQLFTLTKVLADNNTGNGIEIDGDLVDGEVTAAFGLYSCEASSNSIGFSITDTGGGSVVDFTFVGCKAVSNSDDGFDITQTVATVLRGSLSDCISGSNTGRGFDNACQGVGFKNCTAQSNTGNGFRNTAVATSIIGCGSFSNVATNWNITASCTFLGNKTNFGSTTNPVSQATFSNDLVNHQSIGNQGFAFRHHKVVFRMKNNSGGSLALGDTVIIDGTGDGITTSGINGDDKVFGMVLETITSGNYGAVLTEGFTVSLKVDGTTDIAVGDYLCTSETPKIARKAVHKRVAFAVALEAYTTNDTNGVIDAMLIRPILKMTTTTTSSSTSSSSTSTSTSTSTSSSSTTTAP